jgi:hypothetical protein
MLLSPPCEGAKAGGAALRVVDAMVEEGVRCVSLCMWVGIYVYYDMSVSYPRLSLSLSLSGAAAADRRKWEWDCGTTTNKAGGASPHTIQFVGKKKQNKIKQIKLHSTQSPSLS